MRSALVVILLVLVHLACANTARRVEAHRLCAERCEIELADDLDGLYDCEVICPCLIDELAAHYPDEDLASVLTRLDAGVEAPSAALEKAGEECALSASMFPGGDLDSFEVAWYSKHLRAAQERRLEPTGSSGSEVYRLLVLPSFSPTIVVRASRSGDQITYETKKLTGAGGYEPGTIGSETRGVIPSAEWAEFERLLAEARFWSQPSYSAVMRARFARCESGHRSDCLVAFDGTRWVLEGADEARHYIVDRHGFLLEPPLETAMMLLLAVSGNTLE